MRIDNNSLELDDIISDLHSATEESETYAKPGVTAAVITTSSSRPQTASLQQKRAAHKETKDQGAAMNVRGTKIAQNPPKNPKDNSNVGNKTDTPAQNS